MDIFENREDFQQARAIWDSHYLPHMSDYECWMEEVKEMYEKMFLMFLAGWNMHKHSMKDSVAIPENVAQAKAYCLLGEAWLKQNSPNELKVNQ